MPTSDAQGREWVVEILRGLILEEVIDVGPGDGTYCREMREETASSWGRGKGGTAWWVGVEIWEPYVERFKLRDLYDEVVVKDVMDYHFPRVSMVILGDVIEHLERNDALLLISELKQRVDNIIVSLPIVESIQGECEGNPYEAHLYQWDFDEMLDVMAPCSAWRGDVLGRYWWSRAKVTKAIG